MRKLIRRLARGAVPPLAGASALIEHGNGTSWKVVPSHAPGTDSSLRAVAAASATNIWTVGSTFVPDAGTLVPLILHWNGSRWSAVPNPQQGASGQLAGVAVESSSDAWAVGNRDLPGNSKTLIEHWDGRRWTVAK